MAPRRHPPSRPPAESAAGAVCAHPECRDSDPLREHRARFFTASPDALCIVGFDGRFTDANPAFERALGFTRRELSSRPFLEFVHEEDRPATLAAWKRLAAGRAAVSFANRWVRMDGGYERLLWHAVSRAEERLVYATARHLSRQTAD